MRKIVLTLIFIISVLNVGYSQETLTKDQDKTTGVTYKNSIRLLPLSALVGEINFEYERILKNNFSLLLQAYGDFSNTNAISNGSLVPVNITSAYEIGLEIGGRYYFSKRKNLPKGWFIGTGIIGAYKEVNYNSISIFSPRDYNSVIIGGSVKGGYQWVLKSGITIGTASRIQYTQELSKPRNAYVNVLPEISIGYSW